MENTTVIVVAVVAVGGIALYAASRPATPTLPSNPNQQGYQEVPWWQSLVSGLTAGAIIGARTPVQGQSKDSSGGSGAKGQAPSITRTNASLSGVPSNPSGSTGSATARTV